MREKAIEQKLVNAVRKTGGICLKFTSGVNGVPDRLCLLHQGRVAFVEVKAPGEKLRPLQVYRKNEIEKLGFKVYVLDSEDLIDSIIKEIQEGGAI